MKDACYQKVKRSVSVFPSARASQMIAKCRKESGHVRKTPAGTALKRWEREKWKNTKTHKPCGAGNDHSAYCRPTKKISKKTPVLGGSLAQDIKHQHEKEHGQRASVRRHR
tara:strand:+ start:97 stop:429 length:333 start_codon:yes stop_codon:yes gene_type:complete